MSPTTPTRPKDVWIERYVREVGRHLPRRSRADVRAELGSLLRDEIDERLAAPGAVDEERIVVEYLRTFGRPEAVARRYAPTPGVLIGPELYPAYKVVLGIVLGVYALLAVLWATGFQTGIEVVPLRFRFDAATHLDDVLVNAIANVGIVTIVFAAIERLSRRSGDGAEEWDPRDLPTLETPNAETVSRVSQIAHVVGTVVVFLAFNFFPEWLGLFFVQDGEVGGFTLLHPDYRAHLPFLNAWWAGALAMRLALLRTGRWTPALRVFELALGVAGAAILWRIVQGGRFTILDVAVKPMLAIAFVIAVIVQGVRVWRLSRRLLAGRGPAAVEA